MPPDGGWGWLVLAGSMLVNILVPGTIKSFGVLFVEFMEAFKASNTSAAWIPALCYFLYSSLGKKSVQWSVNGLKLESQPCRLLLRSAFQHTLSKIFLSNGNPNWWNMCGCRYDSIVLGIVCDILVYKVKASDQSSVTQTTHKIVSSSAVMEFSLGLERDCRFRQRCT